MIKKSTIRKWRRNGQYLGNDFDLEFWCHFGHVDRESLENRLVNEMTDNGFEIESTDWHQICIVAWHYAYGVIDLDLQGNLVHLTPGILDCWHDNLSLIVNGITKLE